MNESLIESERLEQGIPGLSTEPTNVTSIVAGSGDQQGHDNTELGEFALLVSRQSVVSTIGDGEEDHIAAANMLLRRHDVQASFALTGVKMLNIQEGMRIFTILDANDVGCISMTQLVEGCNSHPGVQSVLNKYDDTPLALLRNRRLVQVMLAELRLQTPNEISMHEWRQFLALLIQHDVRFLAVKGLSTLRCYWGKGVDLEHAVSVKSLLARGPPVWEAWARDFYYYQCNNHPILALFLREPYHPLGLGARLNIEFVCLSFGLFMSGWLYPERDFETILLYITLPIVCIRNTLMFVYKCPCLVVRHEVTLARRWTFAALRCVGRFFGFAFFVVAVIFLITGPISWDGEYIFYYSWMTAWWESYVICVGVDLLVKFNPAPPLLRLIDWLPCGCGAGVVGLCNWQRERALARERIAEDNLYGASAGDGTGLALSAYLFETQAEALGAAVGAEAQKLQAQLVGASDTLATHATGLYVAGVSQFEQVCESALIVAKRGMDALPIPTSTSVGTASGAIPAPTEQQAVTASLGSL